LLVLGGLLTVAALLLAGMAATVRPRTVIRTVTAPSSRAVAVTDPVGCPGEQACAVRLVPPPSLVAAFARAVPGGRVTGGSQTYSTADPAKVLAASLLGQSSDAVVAVSSVCVPGGASPAPSTENQVDASIDLNGDYIVHQRHVWRVSPGQPGCSVSVVLDTTLDERTATSIADALSRDRSAQLQP
jgi:hypothetical protein